MKKHLKVFVILGNYALNQQEVLRSMLARREEEDSARRTHRKERTVSSMCGIVAFAILTFPRERTGLIVSLMILAATGRVAVKRERQQTFSALFLAFLTGDRTSFQHKNYTLGSDQDAQLIVKGFFWHYFEHWILLFISERHGIEGE